MLPHQQRVVDELKELHDKFGKLFDFIASNPAYKSLDAEERSRLKIQQSIMAAYISILEARIEAFK